MSSEGRAAGACHRGKVKRRNGRLTTVRVARRDRVGGIAPAVQALVRHDSAAYTEEYGEFSGFASYGADALGMILQAIEESGSTDQQAIRDALEEMSYTGITGVYDMSAEDHSALDPEALVLITVENGEWKLLEN